MRRKMCISMAVLLVAASFSNLVHAETTAELIRAAKGQARLLTAEDLSDAKSRLLKDVEALSAFLSEASDGDATSLRNLVHFETMQAELAKADGPNLGILNRTLAACRGDEEGLELAPFTNLRRSLRDYMNHVQYVARKNFVEEFELRLEELATKFEAYEANPSTEQAVAIGKQLGWFERTRQITSVVKSVRDRHSHPNLLVVASEQLLASGVRDTVDATEPLRECILGTSIHGTTRLTGQIDLNLVASDGNAAFDITLAGDAVTENVGYNRGVTIYSTGFTDVDATKRVYVDTGGVSSDGANATAATSTNVSSIAAKCRLVRKMAWKQVSKKKYQAEQIASGRAATRVATRMDEQASEMLDEADDSFHGKFRSPLVRRQSFPERFDLHTTDSNLLLGLLRAGRSQMAAPSAAPELEGAFDLGARVHESFAGNMAESMIGGVLLTDKRIIELYEEAEIEVPEDLKYTNDSDAWGITFSRVQPLRVEFAEGGVKIAVTCKSLHQGDEYAAVSLPLKDKKTGKLYPSEIRISRAYDLTTPNDGGIQLVARGELNVEFIDREGVPETSYGARYAAAVGLLKKKFESMLKPKIPEQANDGIVLKGRWEKIGTLKARVAKAESGWLSIGWKQITPAAQAAVEAASKLSVSGAAVVETADADIVTDRIQTASLAP